MCQGPFPIIDKLVDSLLNLQLPDGETFGFNRPSTSLSFLAVCRFVDLTGQPVVKS